jgi:hypothetical protein
MKLWIGMWLMVGMLVGLPLIAQSLVVPTANTNNDGSGFSVWPYGNLASTYQVYLHRGQLNSLPNGINITGLSLRIMGGENTYSQDLVYTDYGVMFSESDAASFAANQLASLTYDDNKGANQTTVHSGPLTIPMGSLVGGSVPNQFSYTLQFTTPYVHTAGTDIVITFRHSSGGTGPDVRMDANNDVAGIVHGIYGSGITDVTGQSGDVLIVKLITPPTPDIGVARGTGGVGDGGTDNIADSYALTALPLTYTISNSGTDDLLLTGGTPVTISNESNCVVNVTQPGSSNIAPAGNTTFTIAVTPQAVGAWSVDVEIANNDPDEAPFDFVIAGNAASGAEIEVRRAGVEVADQAVDVLTRKGTNAYDVVYTIHNLGNQDLSLTGVPAIVATTGLLNCTVSVTQPGSGTIAPTASTTFTLRITPSGTGLHEVTVSIANDDANENPYNFLFQGTAQPEDEDDSSDGGGGCVAGVGSSAWFRLVVVIGSAVCCLLASFRNWARHVAWAVSAGE